MRRSIRGKWARALGAALLVGLLAHPALATDRLDLSIAFKTLPLLTNKLSSPAEVAVVYDADDPQSKDDAEQIKSMIDSGAETLPGGLKLEAFLAAATDAAKLRGARIIFLAQGIRPAAFGGIAAAAVAAGALTISTDLDCVRANKCVLGIVSRPHVEIYYSPTAADAAGISFTSAFTMLVNQI